MPVWLSVLLGCAGVAALGYWVWLRLGRTASARAWARGTERNAINAMCGIPAVGFALIGAALTVPADHGSGLASTLAVLCFVLFVAFGAWGGLQIPVPLWSLPGWARAEVGRRRAAEKRARARRKEAR
jgi:hypothetical protein